MWIDIMMYHSRRSLGLNAKDVFCEFTCDICSFPGAQERVYTVRSLSLRYHMLIWQTIVSLIVLFFLLLVFNRSLTTVCSRRKPYKVRT
jgi:membrane-associated protease RseP (regulator of RpoE activity)